ncbi:hypothetical protein C8R45DRAFT_44614 [Mycena sanguinolenta]|nr:hypothetical protein C8R45DRAFT_44614 [Mycena sanguinolenta]
MPMSNPRKILPPTPEISAHTSTTSKNVMKKFRPPAPISFSSPLKASSVEQCGSGTAANQVFYSSPVRPQYASTSSNVLSIRRGKAGHAFTMHTTAADQAHSAHVLRPKPAGTFSSNSTDFGLHPMPITTSSSTSHSRTATVASFGPLEPALILPSPRDPSPGVASAYPCSQPRVECRRYNLNLPPSSPIRSPSPTPNPSPRRKRESAPKLLPPKKSHRLPKRPASDVYDYFASDPDDEWSTLPARKKIKVAEPARLGIKGIKTSGTFRLPGTAAQAKVTGMSATATRRVVTFLPPPLKAGKVEVLVENSKPEVEDEVQSGVDVEPSLVPQHSRDSSPSHRTAKRHRPSPNPYPSPANSRLTPGTAAIDVTVSSDVLSPPSPIRVSAHRFLSPPTSDPVPDHNLEMHATVAVDVVSQRYPQTKTLMRQ